MTTLRSYQCQVCGLEFEADRRGRIPKRCPEDRKTLTVAKSGLPRRVRNNSRGSRTDPPAAPGYVLAATCVQQRVNVEIARRSLRTAAAALAAGRAGHVVGRGLEFYLNEAITALEQVPAGRASVDVWEQARAFFAATGTRVA